MITGDEIRSARKRAGLSQGRLAELVGVSMRTVGNWERGESAPGIAEPRLMDVLAGHLQVSDDAPRRSRFEAVSDAELLAEIAARFSRSAPAREEGEEDAQRPATTKGAGSGRPALVPPLDPDLEEALDNLPDEADERPPRQGGLSSGRAARTDDPDRP